MPATQVYRCDGCDVTAEGQESPAGWVQLGFLRRSFTEDQKGVESKHGNIYHSVDCMVADIGRAKKEARGDDTRSQNKSNSKDKRTGTKETKSPTRKASAKRRRRRAANEGRSRTADE